ncbi:MAG: hypothetical protein EOO08_03345 [Chitinophagaceae bacterium]|nr:MAG: hypothetical protein EOO08_03345 [Chitinophagaceae bacterium]
MVREQSGAPRSRKNVRSSTTAELKGLFTQANILLHETLDPLVRLQKRTQPAFVEAYNRARLVVDVAAPSAPDAPAA